MTKIVTAGNRHFSSVRSLLQNTFKLFFSPQLIATVKSYIWNAPKHWIHIFYIWGSPNDTDLNITGTKYIPNEPLLLFLYKPIFSFICPLSSPGTSLSWRSFGGLGGWQLCGKGCVQPFHVGMQGSVAPARLQRVRSDVYDFGTPAGCLDLFQSREFISKTFNLSSKPYCSQRCSQRNHVVMQ